MDPQDQPDAYAIEVHTESGRVQNRPAPLELRTLLSSLGCSGGRDAVVGPITWWKRLPAAS
ncbi:hypothetical protein [Actinospica robiniae]|uniref:hypothetical protein n=1 Tax=Actinospica robiniae TaxID=304901 RepID=UPI000429C842|nr:hypothetical protein [Actinospica robiniae]